METCSSRTLRLPLETWCVSPRMGLYGATPKDIGRVVDMLHATTDVSLSNGLCSLLHLVSKFEFEVVLYTDSP